MNNLLVGGSAIQLKKDLGSPNAIQGFVATGITVGAKLPTSLVTTYLFNPIQKSVQISIASLTQTEVWINALGIWKKATLWVNIGGTWKESSPYINIGGIWK